MDAFVHLEEAEPGDPGQLSGASLYLLDDTVSVELDAKQRDGSQLTHCLGYVEYPDLDLQAWPVLPEIAEPAANSDFSTTSESVFWIPLREFYGDTHGFSGARLEISRGELRVLSGSHIFGVLRGRPLADFVECVRSRQPR